MRREGVRGGVKMEVTLSQPRLWAVRGLALAVLVGLASFAVACKGGPKGSQNNPILQAVFVQPQANGAARKAAETLARLLQEKTGYWVETFIPADWGAAVDVLGPYGESQSGRRADIAWITPFTYIMAKRQYDAQALLATVRYGGPVYRGQIMVRADSGIDSLAELKGKRFAYTHVYSNSGFLFPRVLLLQQGYDPEQFFEETFYAGSFYEAVLAVYEGRADGGASYDDARELLMAQYPDVMEKVRVIAYTMEIPSHVVAARSDLDPTVAERLKRALLGIAQTEEGRQALRQMYGFEGLVEARNTFYDSVVMAANLMGVTSLQELPALY